MLKLYFDGACSNNPGGESSYGWLIKWDSKVLCMGSGLAFKPGPNSTNNTAEYTALIKGLEVLREMGATRVTIYGDSQLVISQMDFLWKVKSNRLWPLFQQAQRLAADLRITWCWIPREQNKEADALSKKDY